MLRFSAPDMKSAWSFPPPDRNPVYSWFCNTPVRCALTSGLGLWLWLWLLCFYSRALDTLRTQVYVYLGRAGCQWRRVSTVELWTPFEPKFTSIWYDSVVFSMTPTRRDSELVTVANGVSTVELWTPLNLRLRLSGTILLYSHRRESHWLLSLAVFLL